MRDLWGLGSLTVLTFFFACSSSNDGSPGPSDGGADGGSASALPCNVAQVLADHCQSCHGPTPSFGAPMSLVTWDDLQRPAPSDPSQRVFQMVGKRIHDDANPMPKPPNARLGAADTDILDKYIALGAPKSVASCKPIGGDAGPQPLECTPDIHMAPQGKWTMPQSLDDDYVCFGFDIPVSSKRQTIAITPKIDNKKLVHHVVLYQSDQSESPTPHECSAGGALFWRMIYAWAPGGGNMIMPPEAGFPLEGTTHYVAQLHYNNIGHLSGEADGTGFDMCTTSELRPNDADVVAFGSQSFDIPGPSHTTLTCELTLPGSTGEMHAIFAMPHMHKLGTALSNTLYPANDASHPIDLGSQSTWDFNNQAWLPIQATLHAGDRVETRCAWTNPTQTDVHFGQNTEDEMCYAFTMYYPRVNSPGGWAAPAANARCTESH